MAVNQITGVPHQLLIRALQQEILSQSFPNLHVGERLDAQVAQKLGENRALVLLKGVQVTVEATVPLQVGQKISIQVDNLQPQPLLRLITNQAEPQPAATSVYLKVLSNEQVVPAERGVRLQLGEKLEAQVTQKLGENRVLILTKGEQIVADTPLPLKVGQQIRVQVEALQPQVVLRLVTGAPDGETAVLNGYLKAFRSEPQAMAELFQAGTPLLTSEALKTLAGGLSHERTQALGHLFRTLIFSPETMGNPLFIRDFVNRSGLLLERNLGRMIQEGIPEKITGLAGGDNLKSELSKLAVEIREGLAAKPDMPAEERSQLQRLADYADRSVHTLETQQILNVLSRDQDNRYMIQIPFAFPQSLAMQDIFIEFGGNRKGDREEGAPFRVVLFLNLDALGEMMVDVGIRGEELTAELSCQSFDTLSRVGAQLDDLKANLTSMGFKVLRMTCGLRDDIGPVRNEYVHNSSWFDGDVINFFA